MPEYGELRVDYITYTTGTFPSEGKGTVTVSGLINNPTFSGNVIVGNDLTVSGDINASGVTISGITGLFASGTEAAPSISFIGDTDTGVYSPGANQVAISTNGTGRLFVDANGRVGIGTASPYSGLDIGAQSMTLHNGLLDFRTGDNASRYMYIACDATAGQILATVTNLRIGASSNTIFESTSTGERARITSDGKLGLGTSAPSADLDIFNTGFVNLKVRSSGTNSATLNLTNSTRNYSINSTGGALTFYDVTAGNERLRIDSSGNVGIGTTSPGTKLCVYEAGGASQLRVGNSDIFAWDISRDNAASGALTFKNSLGAGFLERMRIDAEGRLLVGTPTSFSAPVYPGSWTTQYALPLQVAGTSVASTGALLASFSNNNLVGAHLGFCKSSSGTVGSIGTVVANDATLGTLSFSGDDGSKLVSAAAISAVVDGTPRANDMPGRLVFSTTADGASSPTERMRISESGRCSINTTLGEGTAYFDGKLRVQNSTTAFSTCCTGPAGAIAQSMWHQATTGNNLFMSFGTETTHTLRGSIAYNRSGGVVAYNTTSDYRSKTILGAIENIGETIDALKVYRGLMKDATIERPMLVAHEVQEVAPYCVTGEKDAVDDNGDPIYQQMDHQVLVPLLIAEIQQLRSRVAVLEGK